MWLSKKFNKKEQSFAETAVITSAQAGKTEATSSLCAKDISSYAPYGYSYAVPFGEEILMINGRNGGAGAGIKMSSDGNLENGEILIKSLGGASLYLKNDGSIVVNDCITITKDGTVINGNGEEIII